MHTQRCAAPQIPAPSRKFRHGQAQQEQQRPRVLLERGAPRRAFGRHCVGGDALGGCSGANFKEAGWGTDARQLDSDSMKEIDACSLSLQPCADPVVTPQGVLYDRMVVVQYILDRKREIERATREWEAQQAGDAADAAGAAAQAAEARASEEFVARQEGLSAADLAQLGSAQGRRRRLLERRRRLDDGPLAHVVGHGEARGGHELLGAEPHARGADARREARRDGALPGERQAPASSSSPPSRARGPTPTTPAPTPARRRASASCAR